MDYTKGDRVKVINEDLAHRVLCEVSNGDAGTVLQNYDDGFVEVLWDKKQYPNWDIQEEALAKTEGK